MAREVEIGDIVRMVKACAPDAKMRVSRHSILVKRAGVQTKFSKGPGSPRKPEDARGTEKFRVARKVAEVIGIPAACANGYFPDLLEIEPETSGAAKGSPPKA